MFLNVYLALAIVPESAEISGYFFVTDRLNRMVGNILALSRLEAGAWRPQREVIAISELLGAALDTFNDEENKRIRVRIQSIQREIDQVRRRRSQLRERRQKQ